MIRIYGVLRSRAARVHWLAGELGLEVEEVPVIQAYRLADPLAEDAPLNTCSPAYLRINPAGTIPAMDDDGFVLSESVAITLYLARRYGGPLGPRDPQEDALMQQWGFYGVTTVEPPALRLLRGESAGTVAEALRRPLERIEAHIQAEGFLVGGRFTVADINLAELVRHVQAHPALLADHPAVRTWLETCQSRPAFRTMIARREAEPA